ncbi:MAG: hypothetical protein SVM80_12715 [Halobacteriota archaeon]|nr:hypothetical protein [Halobacteriota archaeon]
MEKGSKWYGEEIILGDLKKAKGTIGEVFLNRKIVLRYHFPVSIVAPGFEWQIEPKGSNSVFTAVSYIRAERIMRRLVKFSEYKDIGTLMDVGKKHVKDEGENLKKILEAK